MQRSILISGVVANQTMLGFFKSSDPNPNSNLFATRDACRDRHLLLCSREYCQDILQPPTLLHTVRRFSASLRLEEKEVFVRQWVEHSQAEIRTDYFLLPAISLITERFDKFRL